MSLTDNPKLTESGLDNPPGNPLLLLNQWLKTADQIGINEPRGFILSTVNASGRPSSRVVLLKASDEKGIIFTTNQKSAKGQDLQSNPCSAGTLWWRETIQQVNFTGQTTQLSEEISDKFFEERTREAQAVAVISKQSASMTDEEEMKIKFHQLIHSKNKIERPKEWNAYYLILETIEFWQGSKTRFHKRLRYDLVDSSWQHQKLQP